MGSDGAPGIEAVVDVLYDHGWETEESRWSNDSGEAFAVEPDGGGIPTPDLRVTDPSGEKNPRWVEVKWRKKAIVYEKADEERHGIEIPEWDAHKECQRVTGLSVWIFIVEDSTGTLLRQQVRSLEPIQVTKKMWSNAGGAVLFKRDDFEPLGTNGPFETDTPVQSGLGSF